MTQIASIVYKPQGQRDPEDAYLRVDTDEAVLVAGYGIENDAKGGHPKRNLNVMSYETLTNLRSQGFYTEPGQMGEQLVIHRLDVDNLPPGTRVQLGSSAVIEVVEQRRGCARFSHIQGKSLDLVDGKMGVMAVVISSGPIRVGDPVRVLKPETHV
ncbi:MAG: MOSC domain-containing protein [Chloroflexi bacterium]|nr:MOSC domain-containing protein [Chloroflexota bacterium]